MWLAFGCAAILTAIINLILTFCRREAKWFRFASLSLTALTLCAELELVNSWVLREDWSALMDVVPTLSRALWFLTIASIAINSISLFIKSRK